MAPDSIAQEVSNRRPSAMLEDEYYPMTYQEELNEIMEAFYEAVSEDDIVAYQRFVESIQQKSIAEGAVKSPEMAPDFDLVDQDGERVCLSELLERGPVVLAFYRGKWCPHCNATLMMYQRNLERIQRKGASLVAISPMLPDGTQYLATKRSLLFPVCSDVGNNVARSYRITFEVDEEFRQKHLDWGEDIPGSNGGTWEIPLPATYIIDQSGAILWSFVDNDPGVRADPDDIVAAIPSNDLFENDESSCFVTTEEEGSSSTDFGEGLKLGVLQTATRKKQKHRFPLRGPITNPSQQRSMSVTFRKSIKKIFGNRRQSAPEFLGNYVGP